MPHGGSASGRHQLTLPDNPSSCRVGQRNWPLRGLVNKMAVEHPPALKNFQMTTMATIRSIAKIVRRPMRFI